MTIFAMLPMWMGSQPSWNGVEAGPQEHKDAVSELVELSAGDDARLSVAAELLAVEVDGPAVRWERIARLRQQIAAGTYRVSSQEIAGRIIDAMMR